MKKKIFILTGEASGDKLASTVISKLNQYNDRIDYLSVGGSNLYKLGIKSIFDINEITYIGFTSVIFNILKIKKKIDYTVNEILKFDPDLMDLAPTVIRSEEALFNARKADISSKISVLQQKLNQRNEQISEINVNIQTANETLILVEKQIAIIYVGTNGLMQKVPLNKVKQFENEYLTILETSHGDTLTLLKEGKYTDEIKSVLKKVALELADKY